MGPDMDLSQSEIEVAVRLKLLMDGLFPKAVDDVLCWHRGSRVVYGFRGRGWDLYRRFMVRFPIQAREPHGLERRSAAYMGIQQKVTVHGHRVYLSPQFGSDGETYLQEFFTMLQDMVSFALYGESDGDLYPSVTVLPYPGEPLDADALPLPYFSAAKRKFVQPARKRPFWVLARSPEESPELGRWTVNFCAIARGTPGEENGVRLGTLRVAHGKKTATMMLAHSISLEEIEEGLFRPRVKSCGGMLYPSLSLGPLPATNFGEVVLVFDPRMVRAALGSQASLLRRDVPPDLSIYDSDAQTVDAVGLDKRYGALAYKELAGQRTNLVEVEDRRILSLGPMLSEGTGEVYATDVEPIHSASALAKVSLQKESFYRSIADAKDPGPLVARSMDSTFYRYGYLEAKSSTVVSLKNVVAIVAPNQRAVRAGELLAPLGFEGVAIGLPMSAERERLFIGGKGGVDDPWGQIGRDDPVSVQARVRYGFEIRDLVARELYPLELR